MARPSCFRLLVHWARRAASRADCTAGSSREISTAMMAITTSSSISVKPRLRDVDMDWALGLGEGRPSIDRMVGRAGGGLPRSAGRPTRSFLLFLLPLLSLHRVAHLAGVLLLDLGVRLGRLAPAARCRGRQQAEGRQQADSPPENSPESAAHTMRLHRVVGFGTDVSLGNGKVRRTRRAPARGRPPTAFRGPSLSGPRGMAQPTQAVTTGVSHILRQESTIESWIAKFPATSTGSE